MAFIIPIYPPHYHFVKHIINNIKTSDVYFIFTSVQDYKQFPYPCKSIILEHFLTQEQINKIKDKTLFPSFKKIFAIALLYSKYKYLCCIDSEVKILKEPNLESVYESKVIIGGIVDKKDDLKRNIIRHSITNLTPTSTHAQLKKISYDFRYYTWWSCMPVYKSSTVPKFLNWIGFDKTNEFIEKSNWYFFDNLCYNYYCLLYENFKQIIIPNVHHSLEFEGTETIEKYLMYNLGWINAVAYLQKNNYYKNHKSIYMIYHIDRANVSQEEKKELNYFD